MDRCAYWDFLASLPKRATFKRAELLVPDLLIAEEAQLRVYYAPFDWVNTEAKVAIVGITPGWTQMELACRTARAELAAGRSCEEACKIAKARASFGGPMRRLLVDMLDAIDLPRMLGIETASELFGPAHSLLHSTSAVRYPVLVGAESSNYAGRTPKLAKSKFLMCFTRELLAAELAALPHAVVVPLGTCVAEVLQALEQEGRVLPGRYLLGFPHPSPGNGHRVRQFRDNYDRLREQVRRALGDTD